MMDVRKSKATARLLLCRELGHVFTWHENYEVTIDNNTNVHMQLNSATEESDTSGVISDIYDKAVSELPMEEIDVSNYTSVFNMCYSDCYCDLIESVSLTGSTYGDFSVINVTFNDKNIRNIICVYDACLELVTVCSADRNVFARVERVLAKSHTYKVIDGNGNSLELDVTNSNLPLLSTAVRRCSSELVASTIHEHCDVEQEVLILTTLLKNTVSKKTVDLTAAITDIVPLSDFNKGKAGKIFDEVKLSGSKVVYKNNKPECVLLSPNEYLSLMERVMPE